LWYFQGLERLRDVAILQAAAKCVGAAGVIALVHSPRDVTTAAVLMSAPQLLGAAAALCLGKSMTPASFYRPTLHNVAAALAQSRHMFAASISTTLFLHTNPFLLGLMRGPEAVALYSLANRLVSFLQSLVSPVTQAVFPRASLLFAERRAEAWRLVKWVAWIVLPAISGASLVLVVFAPFIVRLLGGNSFEGVVHVLRIMAIVPVFVAIATLLAQTVMVNVGLTRPLFWIYLSIGVVNLALLPALVTAWSAAGAALALVIAEALGPTLMAWALWRRRATLK
jgi:O-antigen/teichoic acid export membrane protein